MSDFWTACSTMCDEDRSCAVFGFGESKTLAPTHDLFYVCYRWNQCVRREAPGDSFLETAPYSQWHFQFYELDMEGSISSQLQGGSTNGKVRGVSKSATMLRYEFDIDLFLHADPEVSSYRSSEKSQRKRRSKLTKVRRARAEAIRVLCSLVESFGGTSSTKRVEVNAGAFRITAFDGDPVPDDTNITIPVRGRADAARPKLSMVDFKEDDISSGSIVYCSATHAGDECAIRGKDDFYLFSVLLSDVKTDANSTSSVSCKTSESGSEVFNQQMKMGETGRCGVTRFMIGSLQVEEDPQSPPLSPPYLPPPQSPPSLPPQHPPYASAPSPCHSYHDDCGACLAAGCQMRACIVAPFDSGRRLAVLEARELWFDEALGHGETETCDDSCMFLSNDGECDDGGEGSVYFFCAPGTDCTDCAPHRVQIGSTAISAREAFTPVSYKCEDAGVDDYGSQCNLTNGERYDRTIGSGGAISCPPSAPPTPSTPPPSLPHPTSPPPLAPPMPIVTITDGTTCESKGPYAEPRSEHCRSIASDLGLEFSERHAPSELMTGCIRIEDVVNQKPPVVYFVRSVYPFRGGVADESNNQYVPQFLGCAPFVTCYCVYEQWQPRHTPPRPRPFQTRHSSSLKYPLLPVRRPHPHLGLPTRCRLLRRRHPPTHRTRHRLLLLHPCPRHPSFLRSPHYGLHAPRLRWSPT